MMDSCANGVCQELDMTLNDNHYGMIRRANVGWRMTNIKPKSFMNVLDEEIALWYE